jgi:hypothetical protein
MWGRYRNHYLVCGGLLVALTIRFALTGSGDVNSLMLYALIVLEG